MNGCEPVRVHETALGESQGEATGNVTARTNTPGGNKWEQSKHSVTWELTAGYNLVSNNNCLI